RTEPAGLHQPCASRVETDHSPDHNKPRQAALFSDLAERVRPGQPRHAKRPRRRTGQRVQHRIAAATTHLTDRHQPLPPSTKSGKTFSDPAATSYGPEGGIFASMGGPTSAADRPHTPRGMGRLPCDEAVVRLDERAACRVTKPRAMEPHCFDASAPQ